MPVTGGQVLGRVAARVVLAADPAVAADVELGLRGVLGGPAPLLEPGRALLFLEPPSLVLSSCKPAEDGDGLVVRVLNPTDEPQEARLAFGFDVASVGAVRLDETAVGQPVVHDGRGVRLPVPPHALRSIRAQP
jgi:alpha-mannosidase